MGEWDLPIDVRRSQRKEGLYGGQGRREEVGGRREGEWGNLLPALPPTGTHLPPSALP